MFRVFASQIKNNKTIKTFTYEDSLKNDLLTNVKIALEEICYHFDIAVPMWLIENEKHLLRFHHTKFYQRHFIEKIPFDFLEIEIIAMDDKK